MDVSIFDPVEGRAVSVSNGRLTVIVPDTVTITGNVAVTGPVEVPPVTTSSVNQDQVSVTEDSTEISAGSSPRKSFTLHNMHASEILYIAFGAAADTGTGFPVGPGERWSLPEGITTALAINGCYGTGVTGTVAYIEHL